MNESGVNDSLHNSIAHTTRGIYTIVYSMNLLLGLPTNSYILYQIVIKTGVPSEFFTFNLTLCEIIFCFKTPLVLLSYYTIPHTLDNVKHFFEGFIGMGRPLFQTCICVERYLAVIHPVLFLKYKPLRYRLACSAVAWLIVFGCCVMTMLIRYAAFYVYLPLYVILFSGKLFSCLVILRALRNPGPGEGKMDREGANLAKIRAFKIITVIMLSTVVNYVSLLLLLPLQSIASHSHFVLAIAICISISILSGLTQPFIYLHRAGKLSCIKGP